MTYAQAKKEIERLGYRVRLAREPSGGFEFLLLREDGVAVGAGWSAGNKTDAMNSALQQARDRARGR